MTSGTVTQLQRNACTPSRAARELGLRRSEFDLAVHLGQIRTVPDEGGGGRRVTRSELDRLRATAGFPDSLRRRVRLVGTTEGAEVMGIPAGRFTRLARLGLFSPVRFYLNRYRAVVWLYLADELEEFTTVGDNTPLLTARCLPEGLRGMLDEGVDLRARNWRGRHRGFLLRLAEDPWDSAGALAAFLDPVRIAQLVPDPYERSHLHRFRPGAPAHGAQGTPAARLIEKIMTADDPAEIAWLTTELTGVLQDARRFRPAPRPAARETPSAPPPAEPAPREASRGLLGWLRRRSA
ncbi:DUF6397 family protein [Streptomyces pseudovenezuelae]|uniref:DUF6397 family protein n=1 Tax=Streptomyces pseudovenezuelae TaxID=67350 RepID=UPI002E345CBE|nr:DUF6397 family protein [Streptomyces pseudovenezuelae]